MVKQSRVVSGSSSLATAAVLQANAVERVTASGSRWKQVGRASSVFAIGLLAAFAGAREAKAVGFFTDNTLTALPSPQTCPSTIAGGFDKDGCYTSWLTINDLDNDGDMDILLANGGGYYSTGAAMESTVYFNDGKGVFTNVTPTKFGAAMNRNRQVATTDIDGDGDLDIYQPGGFGLDLDKLWIQTTAGSFEEQAATRLPVGLMSRAASTTFGDVDNDGDMDLINMEWFNPSTTVASRAILYTNDGSGHFTLAATQNDAAFASATDRFPATINYIGTSVNVPWPTQVMPITATPYWGVRAIDVDLADVDGDFDLDLMVMHRNGFSRIFLNDGHGNFKDGTDFKSTPNADGTTLSYSTNYPAKRGAYEYNQELCDIDEDGDLDILIDNSGPKPAGLTSWALNPSGSGLVTQLLLNDGKGKFSDDTPNRIFGEPGGDDNAVKCADVNGDGHYDMLVSVLTGRSEIFLLNDGTAHFNFVADAVPIVNNDPSLGVDIADLNGDKIMDMVTGQGEAGSTTPWTDRVYYGGGAQTKPDTTPPAFRGISKPVVIAETPTTFRFAIRDAYTNTAGQMVKNVTASYKISGGATKTVPGVFYGGDLFRATIPAQSAGAEVSVTLSATDRAGNLGTSGEIKFTVPVIPPDNTPTNPYAGAGGEPSTGGGGRSAGGGTGGTAGDEPVGAAGDADVEPEGGKGGKGGAGAGGKGGGKAGATTTTAGSGNEAGDSSEAGTAGKATHTVHVDDGGCAISDATPATKGTGALLGFGLAMLGLVRRRRSNKPQ